MSEMQAGRAMHPKPCLDCCTFTLPGPLPGKSTAWTIEPAHDWAQLLAHLPCPIRASHAFTQR